MLIDNIWVASKALKGVTFTLIKAYYKYYFLQSNALSSHY